MKVEKTWSVEAETQTQRQATQGGKEDDLQTHNIQEPTADQNLVTATATYSVANAKIHIIIYLKRDFTLNVAHQINHRYNSIRGVLQLHQLNMLVRGSGCSSWVKQWRC